MDISAKNHTKGNYRTLNFGLRGYITDKTAGEYVDETLRDIRPYTKLRSLSKYQNGNIEVFELQYGLDLK